MQLDGRGRIVEKSDLVRRLLRSPYCLFDQNGELHARLPSEGARPQAKFADTLTTLGARVAAGAMTVAGGPYYQRRSVRRGHPVDAGYISPKPRNPSGGNVS